MTSALSAKPFLKALGSLWFGAVLLLSLMLAMGSATVHESAHGTEQAKAAFYDAQWFRFLLVLLAVNLGAAVAARYPFSRRQIPFVATHAGLVVILAGALISVLLGVDGRVTLAKGETARAFLVPGEVVTLAGEDGRHESIDLSRPIGGRLSPVENLGNSVLTLDGVRVAAVRYSPDVAWKREVTNDGTQPRLAVEVSLSGNDTESSAWLFAGGHGEVGGRHADLREIPDAEEWGRILAGDAPASKGTLRVTRGDDVFEFPLESCSEQAVAIGETGYTVRVLRYLPHAVVGAKRTLSSASDQPVNPAIEAEIVGPEGADKKIAFARFPDFHGRAGGDHTKDFTLRFIASSALLPAAPVEVLRGPEGELAVRLSGEGVPTIIRTLAVGQSVPTPWPDQTFALTQLFDHARVRHEAVPRYPMAKDRRPAVLLRVISDSPEEMWLQRGGRRDVEAGGKHYHLTYGDRSIPLGFEVSLNEFRIGYYPGGTRARSYESTITLTDPATARNQRQVVSMNHPAKHGGFTFYQSSYQKHGDGHATVLSVARDPGRLIVFIGYIATVLGMALALVQRFGARRRAGRSSLPRGGHLAAGLLAFLGLGATLSAEQPRLPVSIDPDPVRSVIVQHDGRYMPLDTLARDLVLKVTGEREPGGADPVLLLLAWTFDAPDWQLAPLIPVKHPELRQELQLSPTQTVYSQKELIGHERLRELLELPPSESKRDPLRDKVRKIGDKLTALQEVFQGRAILIVPDPDDTLESWRSTAWLTRQAGDGFSDARRAWMQLGAAFGRDDAAGFSQAFGLLTAELRKMPAAYRPTASKIATEIRYNRLRPYRKAWLVLALGTLLSALALGIRRKWFDAVAGIVTLVGFGVLTYGLMLRWTIAGRIPASNMFESLLFLSWGGAAFAIAAFVLFRDRSVPLTAAAIGALSLCLADSLPIDAFIRPIAPVLLDTVWMSIHVPVIMISYAVLAIAVLIAHVQVGLIALVPSRQGLAARIDSLLYAYICSGSLLLLVGIVTGSMWAASSWGRYWGWDPKEVWSLVALLGYLAIIHVRLDHARRPRPVLVVGGVLGLLVFAAILLAMSPVTLGELLALAAAAAMLVYFALARGRLTMAAKSIVAFWLIIMTYVGVNYVLGSGLHSYGFGAGAVASRMCAIGAIDLGLLGLFGGIHLYRSRSGAPVPEAAGDGSAEAGAA